MNEELINKWKEALKVEESNLDSWYSVIGTALKLPNPTIELDNSRHLGIIEDSGWYYDQQLCNPFTSIRLLSNKKIEWDDNKKNWVFSETDDLGYTTPIASAILTEDLQVDVANAWVDNGVDELLGSALNGLVKPYAPYAGIVSKALKKMSESQGPIKKDMEGDLKAKVTHTLTEIIDYFGNPNNNGAKALDAASRLANGSFTSQGCTFTYYQGSSTNFGNLMMRFTIFPNYDETGKYFGVLQQLALLLPFCMGLVSEVNWEDVGAIINVGKDAVNAAESKTEEGTVLNKAITGGKDLIGTLVDAAEKTGMKEQIQRFIKWQNAPGGFMIDRPENMDTYYPGTLCLEIGPNYKLEGLVVSNMNLNFSKQMVKNPSYFINGGTTSSNLENAIEPLYCEVTLQLRPITKYSDRSLVKFVQGNVSNRSAIAKGALDTLVSASKAYTEDSFKTKTDENK